MQIRLRAQPVSLYAAGVAVHDLLIIFVVRIEDTYPALAEEKALALQVVVEIFVLVGTDMIGRQIRENAEVE